MIIKLILVDKKGDMTMLTFTATSTPGEIVKVFPRASDLFKENQIDFCCGGDKQLHDTFLQQDIDGEFVLQELNKQYEAWKEDGHKAKDWDKESLTSIIDYIVHHHHAFLYEELPALGDFVTRIYRVHGMEHPHLKELQRLYNEFRLEMEEHSLKEEQVVFPLIKEYQVAPNDELLKAIRIANGGLEEEHDVCGDILKEMRILTNGFELPDGACNSYEITYERLRALEEETFQHVHLENNILFKRL